MKNSLLFSSESDNVWSKFNKEDDEDWILKTSHKFPAKGTLAGYAPDKEDSGATSLLEKVDFGRYDRDYSQKLEKISRVSDFDSALEAENTASVDRRSSKGTHVSNPKGLSGKEGTFYLDTFLKKYNPKVRVGGKNIKKKQKVRCVKEVIGPFGGKPSRSKKRMLGLVDPLVLTSKVNLIKSLSQPSFFDILKKQKHIPFFPSSAKIADMEAKDKERNQGKAFNNSSSL